MHMQRNISIMTVSSRQNKPLQYVQNKTSENFKMSLTHRYRFACCEKSVFFFDILINHFQEIHRSVLYKITIDYLLYFWDVYDTNLWEKVVITVKLCFIKTRLKKGYDLQGYFLKMTRKMINVLTIAVIHYFS